MPTIDFHQLDVDGGIVFEEKDEPIEFIRGISNIEFPEYMHNRLVDIDESNPAESRVIYSDSPTHNYSPSREGTNTVFCEIDDVETEYLSSIDEDEILLGESEESALILYIHLDLTGETVEDFEEIFIEILDITGSIMVSDMSMTASMDYNFEEFNREFGSFRGEIMGVRLHHGGFFHIIQPRKVIDVEDRNGENEEDDEETMVLSGLRESYAIEDTGSVNFISDQVQETHDLLEGLVE